MEHVPLVQNHRGAKMLKGRAGGRLGPGDSFLTFFFTIASILNIYICTQCVMSSCPNLHPNEAVQESGPDMFSPAPLLRLGESSGFQMSLY